MYSKECCMFGMMLIVMNINNYVYCLNGVLIIIIRNFEEGKIRKLICFKYEFKELCR